MNYPDLDPDKSGYLAAIRYEIEDMPLMKFPGAYFSFEGAKIRAVQIKRSLISGGETGLSAYVTFYGEKPKNFPENGVAVG